MVNKHLQFALIIGAFLISSSVFAFWPFTSSEKTEEGISLEIEDDGRKLKVKKIEPEELTSIVVGGALAPTAACKVFKQKAHATDEKGKQYTIFITRMVVGKKQFQKTRYLVEIANGNSKLVSQVDEEKSKSIYDSINEVQTEEQRRIQDKALRNAAVGARGSKLMKAEESSSGE